MGCDGGTIPKRNEIVKNKKKDAARDKDNDLNAKWQFCALSGLQLKAPIVSCGYGRLYNKEAIIEYLLDRKTSSYPNTRNTVSHIKSLKDVKLLKLKEKPDYDKDHRASSGSEQSKAQFVCPISGLDFNGKYKFFYLVTCGCVFSERALKEVPNEKQCILCSRTYDPDLDLIPINGTVSDETKLLAKMMTRRNIQKNSKKNGKRPDNEASTSASSTHQSNLESSSKRRKIGETLVQ